MAKKAANSDFNMSEAIREILTATPNVSAAEATEVILAKYPGTKLNKNSFSVAFYTGRKKLGIGSASSRRKRVGLKKSKSMAGANVDLAMLQAAAKFLSEVGGAEAAIEAIKQVQAVQVK